jgi:hypothetical protein
MGPKTGIQGDGKELVERLVVRPMLLFETLLRRWILNRCSSSYRNFELRSVT